MVMLIVVIRTLHLHQIYLKNLVLLNLTALYLLITLDLLILCLFLLFYIYLSIVVNLNLHIYLLWQSILSLSLHLLYEILMVYHRKITYFYFSILLIHFVLVLNILLSFLFSLLDSSRRHSYICSTSFYCFYYCSSCSYYCIWCYFY